MPNLDISPVQEAHVNNTEGPNIERFASLSLFLSNDDRPLLDSEMANSSPATLPTSHEELDWSVALTEETFHLVDEHTRALFSMLEHKAAGTGNFDDRFQKLEAKYGYVTNSSIVIHGAYPKRGSYVQCGEHHGSWSERDRDIRLCPYCCNKRANTLADEFGPAFNSQAETWLVTISLSCHRSHWHRVIVHDRSPTAGRGRYIYRADTRSHLPFEPFFIHAIQRLINSTVRSFSRSRKKYVTGAVGRTEVSLCFDEQLKCMPHGHFIFFSDRLLPADFRDLLSAITAKIATFPRLHSWMKSCGVYPLVHARQIRSVPGLRRALRYVMKPVDLAGPYQAAVAARKDKTLEPLNVAYKWFLRELPVLFKGLNGLTRLGGCSGRRKYFGTKARKPRKPKTRQPEPNVVQKHPPLPSWLDDLDKGLPVPATPNVEDNEEAMLQEFCAWQMDREERPNFSPWVRPPSASRAYHTKEAS